LRNVVKRARYDPYSKCANFVYFSISSRQIDIPVGKLKGYQFCVRNTKIIQNLQTSQWYIFRILQPNSAIY
jgi:hypothetical protein